MITDTSRGKSLIWGTRGVQPKWVWHQWCAIQDSLEPPVRGKRGLAAQLPTHVGLIPPPPRVVTLSWYDQSLTRSGDSGAPKYLQGLKTNF